MVYTVHTQLSKPDMGKAVCKFGVNIRSVAHCLVLKHFSRHIFNLVRLFITQ